MSKKNDASKALQLNIIRVRTRLAASVKTGSTAQLFCPGKTDPTEVTYNGGLMCKTNICYTGGPTICCSTA